MNINQLLEEYVSLAMQAAGVISDTAAVVKPASRQLFGDYQVNGIMSAAKKLGMNPRELAVRVLEHLDLSSIAVKTEVAGPGFINIYLSDEWLSDNLLTTYRSEMLGVDKVNDPQTIVVDYSGPNLAKEMHVGHLRSTIIGDAVVRVLDFLGHKVIRQNHVGDWGTQFGMLIAHMVSQKKADTELSVQLADLEVFYRDAKKRFDNEPGFADVARNYVVKLQSGDDQCLELWQQFIAISLNHCEDVYHQLNVQLTREDVKPESSYNKDLPKVIKDLKKSMMLTKSDGAQCVFLDEFKGNDGKPKPVIVQKSDGSYLYATTDLAALRYRQDSLKAQRMLYFVDVRQSLHLSQVYSIAKKAGFVSEDTELEHMAFGTMMGKDGRPFKTRAGGTVKLIYLEIH